jgi:hypothetical protein
VAPLRRREGPVDLEIEQILIAQHRVERSPDLVADRREETALGGARRDRVRPSGLRCG